MNPVRILIIAKEPQAGFAKTRLIPALGAQGAAELADRLLRHTLEQALAADVGPVELCVTPDPQAAYWQHCVATLPCELSAQVNGDLGMRMAAAAQHGLARGTPVMLIGTDCPALNALQLKTLAASLAKQDVCLCPVRDGGYSLLGLRRFDEALLNDMPWSTSHVAALTRKRLGQLDWSWYESEPLWDVDEPEDLTLLRQHYPQLAGVLQ